MKKLLVLLAILPIGMSTIMATSACSTGSKVSLNTVLTKTDLGDVVDINGSQKPTIQELENVIQVQDKDVNLKGIIVKNIDGKSALIEGDGKMYTGTVTVNFTLKNAVNIDRVITVVNLGEIATSGVAKPTADQIMDAVKKANDGATTTNIDFKAITVDAKSISTTGATLISSDKDIYLGTVAVTYKVNASVSLDSVITKTGVGTIAPFVKIGDKIALPTVAQIMSAVKTFNADKSINFKAINVDEKSITTTGATLISLDDNIYTGTVSLTFVLVN